MASEPLTTAETALALPANDRTAWRRDLRIFNKDPGRWPAFVGFPLMARLRRERDVDPAFDWSVKPGSGDYFNWRCVSPRTKTGLLTNRYDRDTIREGVPGNCELEFGVGMYVIEVLDWARGSKGDFFQYQRSIVDPDGDHRWRNTQFRGRSTTRRAHFTKNGAAFRRVIALGVGRTTLADDAEMAIALFNWERNYGSGATAETWQDALIKRNGFYERQRYSLQLRGR